MKPIQKSILKHKNENVFHNARNLNIKQGISNITTGKLLSC